LDLSLAPAIAGYLNSKAGQQAMRTLSTGSHIPHLSTASLLRVPVPDGALDAPQAPQLPLAAALELLLAP
jgi:hypothetical protein